MKKVILVPDSFKGTMSSIEICRCMEEAILRHFPDCKVLSFPVADGGEGTVACFLAAMGGESISIPVSGPFFGEMQASYGILPGGETAVVEMAACAGLPLADSLPQGKNPVDSTTFGVGQMIRDAAKRGCKTIIVGLGGSCTNDGGTGAAAAAGVIFRNRAGDSFVPTGGTLSEIASIDTSGLDPALHGCKIITMCDIDNPLWGETGAAYIFAPQKGADPETVKFLDGNLRALDAAIQRDLGLNLADMPGAGAAGGMGAGMAAFFSSELRQGIQVVLDTVGFDGALDGADLVLTGEGRIDGQSLRGKVVIGVAGRAKKRGVPVVAVVGDIGDGVAPAYGMGVSAMFSTNLQAKDFGTVRHRSREFLCFTMDNIMRLFTL